MDTQSSKKSYPLRLSKSLQEAVRAAAQKDGISINRFIELALAEKTVRLETHVSERLAGER